MRCRDDCGQMRAQCTLHAQYSRNGLRSVGACGHEQRRNPTILHTDFQAPYPTFGTEHDYRYTCTRIWITRARSRALVLRPLSQILYRPQVCPDPRISSRAFPCYSFDLWSFRSASHRANSCSRALSTVPSHSLPVCVVFPSTPGNEHVGPEASGPKGARLAVIGACACLWCAR